MELWQVSNSQVGSCVPSYHITLLVGITQGFFPYNKWKQTVKKCIQSKENVYWTGLAVLHESVYKNVSAFAEITFETFWLITLEYPD